MNVEEMEVAKSLFNPKRVRIIRLVSETAMTVKEMAKALDEKPSRLYYHVHKLVDQGLLLEAASKQVRHLTETYYKAAPGLDSFNITADFGKENTEFVMKELMVHVNKSLEAIQSDLRKGDWKDFRSNAGILQAELSLNEYKELNKEIRELINKHNQEAKGSGEIKKLFNYVLLSYSEEEEN